MARFRVHSPTVTYAYMYDGEVSDELRDLMFFKGMHLFYPGKRVERPLLDVVLKRQSEMPRLRIPKDLPDTIRPLLPRHPPIRLTDKDRELIKKIEDFEKAAMAIISTPIVAVWGLRTSDGAPDEHLILYANGRANDPSGKLSWDWRDKKITLNFPRQKRELGLIRRTQIEGSLARRHNRRRPLVGIFQDQHHAVVDDMDYGKCQWHHQRDPTLRKRTCQ
ncbi:MAG: hypothetical protein IH991_22640 [Planctomycetes bacterium]|nr:hypothetical protein [Planctomycetota bacterium]